MSQWPRLKLSNSLSLGQGFRVFIWGWGDKYGHIVNMYVFFRAHKSLGYPSDHCPPFMNWCLRTSNNKSWGNSQRSLRLGTVWGVHIRAIILRWQSMSEGLLFVLKGGMTPPFREGISFCMIKTSLRFNEILINIVYHSLDL